jgi:imidazolonepropionase-like amidohydrolase
VYLVGLITSFDGRWRFRREAFVTTKRVIVALLTAAIVSLARAQELLPIPQGHDLGMAALVGATLIDGTGGPLILNSVILIRNGRIEKVGTQDSLAIPSGYNTISTEGMTVLPGLWDMHTHLQYSAHADLNHWNSTYQSQMERTIMPAIASQLLMAGITSARDPMAPTDAVLHVKARIASGEIPGPTMYVSGALLEHKPPAGVDSFRWGVSGVEDARIKVNRLADKGVDLIKLLCVPEMTVDEAKTVVDQAHARRLKVAAHGRADDEVRKCLAAGVDDFQHLSPQAIFPEDIIAGIKERIRRQPLIWTPTVGELYSWERMKTNPEILDDPAWHRGLPAPIIKDVRESMASFRTSLAKRPSLNRQVLKQKFNQLRQLGVQMLVGTDSGSGGHFHPQSVWLELDALVNELGVEPMAAIHAATLLPAEVMGVQQNYGSLEPGKFADLIAVHGDPLQNINILRDPVLILKHGIQYK